MLPHPSAPLLLTLSLKEGKAGSITYNLQTEEWRQTATFSGPLDHPASWKAQRACLGGMLMEFGLRIWQQCVPEARILKIFRVRMGVIKLWGGRTSLLRSQCLLWESLNEWLPPWAFCFLNSIHSSKSNTNATDPGSVLYYAAQRNLNNNILRFSCSSSWYVFEEKEDQRFK